MKHNTIHNQTDRNATEYLLLAAVPVHIHETVATQGIRCTGGKGNVTVMHVNGSLLQE